MTIKEQILECIRISLPESTAKFAKELLDSADKLVEAEKKILELTQRLDSLSVEAHQYYNELSKLRSRELDVNQQKAANEKMKEHNIALTNTLDIRMKDLELTLLRDRVRAIESLVDKFVGGPRITRTKSQEVPVVVPGSSSSSGYVNTYNVYSKETEDWT